jgi:hypothetical protein
MAGMQDQRDKEYLDLEKGKFDSLQDLLKQVLKTNETSLTKRVKFQQKWYEIAQAEPDRNLSESFHKYSEAIERADRAERESLQQLRAVSQRALRLYPEKIKNHQRSISTQRKARQTLQEHASSLKKLQDQRDQRSVSVPALHKHSSQVETSEREVKSLESQLENDLRLYREGQVEDLKELMLHLLNAEMHYHAVALDALCAVVPVLHKVDPSASLRARSFK